eukprot:COSAG04_NODE_4459_length_2077_cov_1.223458_1_plen_173_part_10
MFGRGWKADHEPFLLTGTAEMSAARDKGKDGGMSVHGTTARHFGGHAYYEYNNGQIRNGLSNCVYILKDINEGDGGVGFVPGSHKANYEVPPDIARSANDGIMYPVVNPTAKAGDLIVRRTLPFGSAHARRLTPRRLAARSSRRRRCTARCRGRTRTTRRAGCSTATLRSTCT